MTYPYFIEVHAKEDATVLAVNIDGIIGFGPTGENATILTADNGRWVVRESYEEIKTLIKSTGCLIQKGDPRLESKPLTWDDLCKLEMVGQPVWNSNTRQWMLLIDSSLDGRSWIDLIDNCGKTFRWMQIDAEMYPLYRMRRE